MTTTDRIQDGDKVISVEIVGTANSKPFGVKVIFYVKHKDGTYTVEEQTASTFSYKDFTNNKHRKRDSQRAYARATKTTFLRMPIMMWT